MFFADKHPYLYTLTHLKKQCNCVSFNSHLPISKYKIEILSEKITTHFLIGKLVLIIIFICKYL